MPWESCCSLKCYYTWIWHCNLFTVWMSLKRFCSLSLSLHMLHQDWWFPGLQISKIKRTSRYHVDPKETPKTKSLIVTPFIIPQTRTHTLFCVALIFHSVSNPALELTRKLQFKALTGAVAIWDEFNPHGAGSAVDAEAQHLPSGEGTQQTGRVVVAIVDLEKREELHVRMGLLSCFGSRKSFQGTSFWPMK